MRLESNDRLSQVHDRTVCANRSTDDIVGVFQIDDNGLGGSVGIVVDLAHANVFVGLESLERWSGFCLMVKLKDLHHIHSFATISMLAIDSVSLLPLGLDSIRSLV